ncbi:hypothetical protein BH11PLA2_BH11PLA2_52780 [soil metagenome]
MRIPTVLTFLFLLPALRADEPSLLARPDAFPTLVNPNCSHCVDEAKRRSGELLATDPVLVWTRGYSEGGVIPIRFFLNSYRVISDSYGVFVHDPEAGYARAFAASYHFKFHGWRNGVMIMKDDRDGTLYSCLTGLAFEGPKKGTRLETVPTLVSHWGPWTDKYPNAVAYHMFEKYKPTDLPKDANADSLTTRLAKPDPRLKAEEMVLGFLSGKTGIALPVALMKDKTFRVVKTFEGDAVVLHDLKTGSLAAYRPKAHQPRKWRGLKPDKDGVSPKDDGVPLPEGSEPKPAVVVELEVVEGKIRDRSTKTVFDVAGRGVDGPLKGWTLEPVDAVACKWFAWSAEYPATTVVEEPKVKEKARDVAGSAEFLRLLPKPWAVVKAVDVKARTVTLLLDGEKEAKAWPLEPDAEIKVAGWWGRLEQFNPEQRVWVWLALDRNKQPKSVAMIADELSEQDIHAKESPELDAARTKQKAWLNEHWQQHGLPGTLSVKHVFSGEVELQLDHEAMRWGRSLTTGDEVSIATEPPIRGLVKQVTPWRERTVVRLVVGELQVSDLTVGQRLQLKMKTPPEADRSPYPLDIHKKRTPPERVEWFLASTYCVCGVGKDICTGMFYTLASCNPNGCGAPQATREEIQKMIDRGLTDPQIWDAMLKEHGPLMTRPHLRK